MSRSRRARARTASAWWAATRPASPNGRRIGDNVVTIEIRAVAGLTIPLVDPSFTPDGAASAVTDGTTNTNAPLLEAFPYLGLPGGGYQTEPGTTQAS